MPLRKKAYRTRAGKRRGSRFRRSRYSLGRRRIGTKKVSKTVIKGRGYPRDTTIVKLRYSAYVLFTTLSGQDNVAFYTFRGNSCFDPDYISTTVARPYYWDQWSSQYERYRVMGSSIRASVQPYVPSNNTLLAYTFPTIGNFAIIPSLQASAGAIIINQNESLTANEQLRSLPYCRSKYTSNAATIKESTIRHYMPTGKLEGRTRSTVLADQDYQATINNNPNSGWYWHLFYWNPLNIGGEEATSRAICRLDITYYVKFEHRQLVAPSPS